MQFQILSLDDDDPATQMYLMKYLSFNMNVELCKSSQEAFDLLRKKAFDVLLLDKILRREGVSGIDLVPALKYEFPNLAIIILSHDDNFAGMRQAFSYGASDFLLKSPLLNSELQIKIPEAISKIRNSTN
jgi:DNA-binding NarL/FixJ family response regulator